MCTDHPFCQIAGKELSEMSICLTRKFWEIGLEQTQNVFRTWPYFNNSGHPLMERKRSRSLLRKGSPRNPPRRGSSVPPISTFQPVGEEFKALTVVRDAKGTEQGRPRSIEVGDLVLDVTEALSGTPFMRVRRNNRSFEEAFMFSACSRQGFFKLDIVTQSEFPPPRDNVLMDNVFWKATHLSGLLEKKFSRGNQM